MYYLYTVRQPLERIDSEYQELDDWEITLYIMALAFTFEGKWITLLPIIVQQRWRQSNTDVHRVRLSIKFHKMPMSPYHYRHTKHFACSPGALSDSGPSYRSSQTHCLLARSCCESAASTYMEPMPIAIICEVFRCWALFRLLYGEHFARWVWKCL